MSLTVETGQGLASAESFATVAEADARHSALGNADWAALAVAKKEEALRRATNYLEQQYRTRWTGQRLSSVQALSWPRAYVLIEQFSVGSNVVPPEVKAACIDMALKAATAELITDSSRTVLREKIGPLETEYDANSRDGVHYKSVAMMLTPFLKGARSNISLARA